MKIYLNKRDMKQLEKILGLGWTELKEDFFFWGLRSWHEKLNTFWAEKLITFWAEKLNTLGLNRATRFYWNKKKERHWMKGKKKKKKKGPEGLKQKREKAENWKEEVLKLKGRGWTGRTEMRYIFSIYFPSTLLRKWWWIRLCWI